MPIDAPNTDAVRVKDDGDDCMEVFVGKLVE